MKIVIDINEHLYKTIKTLGLVVEDGDAVVVSEAIKNGTPLPKRHGRLIDADRLTRAEILHIWYHLPNGDIACPKIDIDHAPTVIEADRGE